MSPTVVQRLFAHDWPMRITLVAGAIGMMAWTAPVVFPALRSSFLGMVWFLCLMIVAGLLGLIVAGILGGMFFLGPLYHWRAAKNGAPYQVGDTVLILAGAHRDRVARVYEVWSERGQVRVELGEEERRAVTDVFSYVAVCRHSAVE
jgi:hypothetical protein